MIRMTYALNVGVESLQRGLCFKIGHFGHVMEELQYGTLVCFELMLMVCVT